MPSAQHPTTTFVATVTAACTAAAALLTGGAALIISNVGEAGAAPANLNQNCTLIAPADPLSARGLATPYQLIATDPAAGPCNEANPTQSAFVEAAILSENGQLITYDPLVIDQGTQPAAPTVPATVTPGATVAIWFGFNGAGLTLKSADGTNALAQGHCVNGLPRGSIFGQFAYCNAPAFFVAAKRHQLQVPALGTAKDGLPCPTVRDFSVVDQDQSDNVVTHYLATANGQIAQNNAANTAKLANPVDLANGSDNLLLSRFIDPALGCAPWTTPNQSSDGQPSAALAMDELSAAAHQKAPIALVPLTDPMTLNNGNPNVTKTNLYRQGVDQGVIRARNTVADNPAADATDNPTDEAADNPEDTVTDARNGAKNNGNGVTYCANMFATAAGIQRVFKDQAIFSAAPSVDPAAATNLFTFLAMRAQQTFGNLNCQTLINTANPITLTTDGNGVVTAATFTAGGATTTTTDSTTITTSPSDTPPSTDTGTLTTDPPTITTTLPTDPPPSTDTSTTDPAPPSVTDPSSAPPASTDPSTTTRPRQPGRHGGGRPPTTFGRHW
ncbi:hypothetical protein [Nocardia sp. NPDC006630]|uniref:hypothetical protein n=1 Tax=Nocardia sp. NPDC006630 TaxID=3157181 RepID=UPI0033B7C626